MTSFKVVNLRPASYSPQTDAYARGYRAGADIAHELARADALAYRQARRELGEALILLGDAIASGSKAAMIASYAKCAEAFSAGNL